MQVSIVLHLVDAKGQTQPNSDLGTGRDTTKKVDGCQQVTQPIVSMPIVCIV
jgi:hypothetical protein